MSSKGIKKQTSASTGKVTKLDKNVTPKPKPTKEALLQALVTTRGHITNACKQIGISRETYYGWKEEDPVFAQKMMKNQELMVELAEERLQEFIANYSKDSFPATALTLKTLGRKRGYFEKQEVDIVDYTDAVIEAYEERKKKNLAVAKDDLGERDNSLLDGTGKEQ